MPARNISVWPFVGAHNWIHQLPSNWTQQGWVQSSISSYKLRQLHSHSYNPQTWPIPAPESSKLSHSIPWKIPSTPINTPGFPISFHFLPSKVPPPKSHEIKLFPAPAAEAVTPEGALRMRCAALRDRVAASPADGAEPTPGDLAVVDVPVLAAEKVTGKPKVADST